MLKITRTTSPCNTYKMIALVIDPAVTGASKREINLTLRIYIQIWNEGLWPIVARIDMNMSLYTGEQILAAMVLKVGTIPPCSSITFFLCSILPSSFEIISAITWSSVPQYPFSFFFLLQTRSLTPISVYIYEVNWRR